MEQLRCLLLTSQRHASMLPAVLSKHLAAAAVAVLSAPAHHQAMHCLGESPLRVLV